MNRRAWVVLADRRKARFFLHAAPGEALTEAGPGSLEFVPAKQAADRPGRVHERTGSGRSSVEPTTSAEHLERDTAGREIARVLTEGAAKGEFDRLVIAAAPELVGAIRPQLTVAVRDRLVGEIQHRLLDLPPKQLAARLTEEGMIGRVAG
jgi:protein required for attachment to host cells